VVEAFGALAAAITVAMRSTYEQAGRPLGADDGAMWEWAGQQASAEHPQLDVDGEAAWQASLGEPNRRGLAERRRH
jgi:hypothetical protein